MFADTFRYPHEKGNVLDNNIKMQQKFHSLPKRSIKFDVSSKGPSSGIGGGGWLMKSTRVFIQVNILKQHVTK